MVYHASVHNNTVFSAMCCENGTRLAYLLVLSNNNKIREYNVSVLIPEYILSLTQCMSESMYAPSRQTQFTEPPLKHTTTLFSLSDHCILSREWRVIVDQVKTNHHGRPMVL